MSGPGVSRQEWLDDRVVLVGEGVSESSQGRARVRSGGLSTPLYAR
jgi:hypothetical protein